MHKKILWILLPFLTLTACSFNFGTAGSAPSDAMTELPAQTKLILGIIKLDETETAISAEQAKELLPMFHVLQDLNESDTAAQEEIDGLTNQIGETLTDEQSQAIEAMTLSRQDMMSLMRGNSGANNPEAEAASGGGFPGGGPPDMGGGFPGGGMPGGMTGGGIQNTSASAEETTRPAMQGTPSALFDTIISLLEEKVQAQ